MGGVLYEYGSSTDRADSWPPAERPRPGGLGGRFLLSSCGSGPTSRTVDVQTEDESLVRTSWQVVEITFPDGVTHLPYGGAQGPLESPPVVEYDPYGHVAMVFDGVRSYRADRTSNTFEFSLREEFGNRRAAFPDGSTSVLLYGRAERNGSSLMLTWDGYTARLQLASEDRYNPASTAPGS